MIYLTMITSNEDNSLTVIYENGDQPVTLTISEKKATLIQGDQLELKFIDPDTMTFADES